MIEQMGKHSKWRALVAFSGCRYLLNDFGDAILCAYVCKESQNILHLVRSTPLWTLTVPCLQSCVFHFLSREHIVTNNYDFLPVVINHPQGFPVPV